MTIAIRLRLPMLESLARQVPRLAAFDIAFASGITAYRVIGSFRQLCRAL